MFTRIPLQFVGAWRRLGIQAGDSPLTEDSHVIWLQSGSRYTDIRVPAPNARADSDKLVTTNAGVEAFAGGFHWQAPTLTFEHELDFTANYPDDQGDLSWEADTLVETGRAEVNGKTIAYREYWQRLSRKSPVSETWEIRGSSKLIAIALRIDDHACVISNQDQFGATLFTREDGVWHQKAGVGRAVANLFASGFPAPWKKIDDHPTSK